MGSDFELSKEKWKVLIDLIEAIIKGSRPLFPLPKEIETLARTYAKKLIRYQGEDASKNCYVSSCGVEEPHYHRLDINTMDNEDTPTVGAESLSRLSRVSCLSRLMHTK